MQANLGKISNTLASGTVEVLKVDSTTKEPIAGVRFQLIGDRDNDGIADAGEAQILDEKTTDADGRIQWNNVPAPANIVLKEVEAPAGYTMVNGGNTGFRLEVGETKRLTVTNERVAGTVSWQKVSNQDSSKLLGGSEWSIRNSAGVEVAAITDCTTSCAAGVLKDTDPSEGKFSVAGLPWGDYKLVETKAPLGYSISSTERPFTIGKQANGQVTTTVDFGSIQNQITTGTVIVTKTDATSGAPLKGVEFGLYGDFSPKGQWGPEDRLVTKVTTDDNGRAQWNYVPTNGDYVVKEEAAPAGYTFSTEGDVFGFRLVHGQTKELAIQNVRLPGTVSWQKVSDQDSSKLLGGSEWSIRNSAGAEVAAITDCTTSCTTGDLKDTDPAEGQFSVTGLPWGNYKLVETKAPAGYSIGATATHDFTIGKQTDDTVQATINLGAITNKLSSGTVSVLKVDSADDKPLSGARFQLIGDANRNGVADEGEPQFLDEKETDADGRIQWDNVPAPANFVLKEVGAPAGYAVINNGNTGFRLEIGGTQELTVKNERVAGTVSWNKIDDARVKIGGSEWSLSGPVGANGANGTIAITDCTAAPCSTTAFADIDPAAGQLKINGLPWGEYTLTETKAPANHELGTETTKTFTVGASTVVDAHNNPIEQSLGDIVNQRTGVLTWGKFSSKDGPANADWPAGNTDPAVAVFDQKKVLDKALPGSVWKVVYVNNNRPPEKMPLPDGKEEWLVEDCATGEGGSCSGFYDEDPRPGMFSISGLPLSSSAYFVLTEEKAPEGYIKSDTNLRFRLATGVEGVYRYVYYRALNEPQKGSASWTKVDDVTPANPLGGSEWKLTAPDGKTYVVTDCETGTSCPAPAAGTFVDTNPAKGSFSLAGQLPWGTYKLTESKAPAGFVLDNKAYEFTIDADNLDYTIAEPIVNVKATPPVLPFTGGLSSDVFRFGALGAFGAAAISAIFLRRRKAVR
ncbi:hypothetical protein I6E29_09035 [Arcanobacterium haemolyticum]|nr:hypothetical protein [Arcanobacterium haemolyticum]